MIHIIKSYKNLFTSLLISNFDGGPEGPSEQIDQTQELIGDADIKLSDGLSTQSESFINSFDKQAINYTKVLESLGGKNQALDKLLSNFNELSDVLDSKELENIAEETLNKILNKLGLKIEELNNPDKMKIFKDSMAKINIENITNLTYNQLKSENERIAILMPNGLGSIDKNSIIAIIKDLNFLEKWDIGVELANIALKVGIDLSKFKDALSGDENAINIILNSKFDNFKAKLDNNLEGTEDLVDRVQSFIDNDVDIKKQVKDGNISLAELEKKFFEKNPDIDSREVKEMLEELMLGISDIVSAFSSAMKVAFDILDLDLEEIAKKFSSNIVDQVI